MTELCGGALVGWDSFKECTTGTKEGHVTQQLASANEHAFRKAPHALLICSASATPTVASAADQPTSLSIISAVISFPASSH